ncbi:type II toxin-antitoxin system RelE/ParE family toxin [Candidatus Woesearchaeota archaeon]|nr:type II toxin-antitoxin system RelE/ParE family toxin [Candidatus Woesearchaeota archaeon]
MFNIEFSNQSKKFLKKSDKQLAMRIIESIEVLGNDPVPHDSKRVVGEDRTFRIRIGDYRVLYEVDWNKNLILIDKIDKRSKAYD